MKMAVTGWLGIAVTIAACAPLLAADKTIEKAKAYTHTVFGAVSVTDKYGDIAGTEGTCDVTVHIVDNGGVGPADPKTSFAHIKIPGTSPHTGDSGTTPIEIDKDEKCHVQNQLDAWPAKVSCTFGPKTVEETIDPNKVPGATGSVAQGPNDHWFEPDGKWKKYPKSFPSEKYTGPDGKVHSAPKRTGEQRSYSGQGPITGGGSGTNKGDIAITVTLIKSGRECAAGEERAEEAPTK
jgi:hypothetical protein